jgi:hypothetical protein
MKEAFRPKQMLFFLLVLSTLIRALIAGLFELGNDEVYYWTYAVYPDLSHFDHPPMLGWLIRFFTFNLHFQQEFYGFHLWICDYRYIYPPRYTSDLLLVVGINANDGNPASPNFRHIQP